MAILDSKLLLLLPSGAAPPGTAFIGAPLSGTVPLAVTFTDHSSGAPTSWSWTFGDGGTSASQNPVHVYLVAGTYTVTLTATNANGSRPSSKVGYIKVSPTPAKKHGGFEPEFDKRIMRDDEEMMRFASMFVTMIDP